MSRALTWMDEKGLLMSDYTPWRFPEGRGDRAIAYSEFPRPWGRELSPVSVIERGRAR